MRERDVYDGEDEFMIPRTCREGFILDESANTAQFISS